MSTTIGDVLRGLLASCANLKLPKAASLLPLVYSGGDAHRSKNAYNNHKVAEWNQMSNNQQHSSKLKKIKKLNSGDLTKLKTSSLASLTDSSGLSSSSPTPPSATNATLGSTVSAQHASMDTVGEKVSETSPVLIKPKLNWPWLPVYTTSYQATRNVIVLCHGLWGFDKLGFDQFPRLQVQYWGNIHETLLKLGAKVVVSKVPSTGTIAERARALHSFLDTKLEPGQKVNLIAHSMGGLDCRYLLTHVKPSSYRPVSLTTLSTPHRGSPFMDFCRDYLGLGRVGADQSAGDLKWSESNHRIPETRSQKVQGDATESGFTAETEQSKLERLSSSILTRTMLARTLDTPAYGNLTTSFLNQIFNPSTPDMKTTKYYSYGAVVPLKDSDSRLPVWNPLYIPHMVVSEKEGPNDGLVSVQSSKWGQYVGTLKCDHWDLRTACKREEYDTSEMYRALSTFLFNEGF